MPARYILRFTLCEKFSSGEFGKILPPPRHSGLEVMPARARRCLLAPRLLGGVVHRAAVLLRARADARVRLVGDDELVHQRLVEIAREHCVFAFTAPLLPTILSSMIRPSARVAWRRACGLRRQASAFGSALGSALGAAFGACAFTGALCPLAARRTTTSPPLGPAPTPSRGSAAARDRCARSPGWRWCAARRRGARACACRENARRALVLAGGARRPVRDRVAVARALRGGMVALDDAGESLADGDALHVDELPDLEQLLHGELHRA